ncbi:MAG: hypothetical protein ACO262_09825 [Vulcanococcus sp.]|jgi:hypothetical protein
MARTQIKPQAEDAPLPPPPAAGGSYILSDGVWLCVQQTAPAAAAADTAPESED